MKCRRPWATALAAAALCTLGAHAAPKAASADAQFARKAAEAGMDEVEAGKLARDRASDDAVRRFAERMVDDHTKAGERLQAIAHAERLSIPDKLDKSGEQDLDKLTKLHGHAFDVAYIKHNVTAHKKAVKDFTKEARSGHDAQLKQFAAETLPTLKEHLQLAQSAAQAVGASSPRPKQGKPGR